MPRLSSPLHLFQFLSHSTRPRHTEHCHVQRLCTYSSVGVTLKGLCYTVSLTLRFFWLPVLFSVFPQVCHLCPILSPSLGSTVSMASKLSVAVHHDADIGERLWIGTVI